MPTETKKYTDKQELIAKFSNALGHPVRVAILQQLSKQSCCFHGDMADVLPIANSTLSQHLKVLREAGLIQGEIDPPKTKYCINKENWNLAKGLMIGFFD
ncbi:MAG TPA: winged helix-turn-helix domain-containing protein [Bacteroidia bacterium]|nr:winged helix-turn-helix domain-containing protein [Bacteroidia bacterium]